jgi:Fe-S oxidoreductase
MLQGDVIGKDGWHDDHVKEALDLCLACKGCKGDCPVNVDMATYKAEFLSHYYAGRLRPRHAYSMGLIYWWARLASMAPSAANFLTQTPGLAEVMKLLGGIAPERRLPRFAPLTFTEWFHDRTERGHGTRRVILWPDTFNNYFLPHTAKAAVEVLEMLGCRVCIPQASLCCGRPLYDFGMLDTAKRLLRRVLRELRADIVAGTPVIGLEPSCVAVFRDELVNLFPHDEDARRLSHQTLTFAEFLQDSFADRPLPRLGGKAIVHGHCHQKALIGMTAEEQVLSKLGLDATMLDSGCCGMAGSFGFTAQHWETSMQIGELVLLPSVRKAARDDLIIADGFSCREQIAQATNRRGLHLAEVVHLALQREAGVVTSDGARRSPEIAYLDRNRIQAKTRRGSALLGIALLAGAGLLWLWHPRASRARSAHRAPIAAG